MIDGYNWWLPTATADAGSGSSHRCQVMSGSSTTLTNSDNDLRRETRATSAALDGRSDAVGIREWDKEELRSESLQRRKVINWAFLSSVSSLLFSSYLLLHWISARYKWRRHGFYHLPISVNGRLSFPVGRIHRTGTVRCQSVAGLLSLYEYVRGMICLMLSFSFLLYGLCSPGGLRLKRGMM